MAQQTSLVAAMMVLALSIVAAAATKDSQPPDREMLRMIEFLRQMEMIKQMDMMRDMHHLEQSGEPAGAPPKMPSKKAETRK